jgi:hypothetical protein
MLKKFLKNVRKMSFPKKNRDAEMSYTEGSFFLKFFDLNKKNNPKGVCTFVVQMKYDSALHINTSL